MVTTGNKTFAGTDDNVYITITGSKGSTQSRKLKGEKTRNNFEKGRTDKFIIKSLDLGTSYSPLGYTKTIALR